MLRQAIAAPSRAVRSALRVAGQQPLSLPRTLPRTQFRSAPLAAAPGRPLQQLFFPRWYSAEAESSSDKKTGEEGNQESVEAPDTETALKKELEAKSKEILEWKDRYLRSVADFRNLQDRTARDMKSARDFAIQNFAKDLVDSVDNLDRALSTVSQDKLKTPPEAERTEHQQDLVNLYEGLKMTENILMQTLGKHGLGRFDPDGEKFNPNEHEATFMTPMPDKEDGTVFHTQQKGFRLNGRVLRPAKVGVVKNS